jgi:hypothetical protein
MRDDGDGISMLRMVLLGTAMLLGIGMFLNAYEASANRAILRECLAKEGANCALLKMVLK